MKRFVDTTQRNVCMASTATIQPKFCSLRSEGFYLNQELKKVRNNIAMCIVISKYCFDRKYNGYDFTLSGWEQSPKMNHIYYSIFIAT